MSYALYILKSDLRLMMDMEEFCISYVCITGRSLRSAERPLRRLNRLANANRDHSMTDLMKEWRRRYIEGWAYTRARRRLWVRAR